MEYKCGLCGATDCKLWREYQTFLEHQALYCAPCGAKAQGKSIEGIDSKGQRPTDEGAYPTTNTIGWLVPAVPVDDTFWGYTSVPQEDWERWEGFPTLPVTQPGTGK